MSKDYSPFTPGQPVPVEFFVGRLAEVTQLLDKVRAATRGRLQVVFLSGERGIGKSSLAAFVRFASEREFSVLGLHTFLRGREKVLDNFLTRMRKLNVIKLDPEKGPGVYSFVNELHRLYFFLEAERARKMNQP